MLKDNSVVHIHAHWGGTTSTIAYIISKSCNIPWSFTLHRWDIYENNILKEKVETSDFARCISIKGKKDLLNIIGSNYEEKVKVIHLGIKIPKNNNSIKISRKNKQHSIFNIVVPADLLPQKGHIYIIEACNILYKKGIKNFKCFFYGEGSSENELRSEIIQRDLTKYIEIKGQIQNDNLLDLYKKKEVNLVVLPSIVRGEFEFEGIPYSLIEAMAYNIPTISTNTGSIVELLDNMNGIIVNQKDPILLANAIEKLMFNTELYIEISNNGFNKIKNEFNSAIITKELLRLFGCKN